MTVPVLAEIDQFEKLLTKLEQHGPKLREAGVTAFSVGDVHVELARHEPPLGDRDDGDEDPDDPDPLNDPTTYGLRPGARLPGFPNARKRRDEDENE
jgi:hypothetical protein